MGPSGPIAFMLNINTDHFALQFGDAHSGLTAAPCAFLKQVHSATCRVVTSQTYREYEGDSLLTRTPGLAIGVVTADCVPLALYDAKNHAAAMVHAGWRGALGGVVQETIKEMQAQFATTPEGLMAYIGPCARRCCYEVGPEVAAQVPACALTQRDESLFLDMPTLVGWQLQDAGIAQASVLCEYTCTICSPQYHSYRRDGSDAGRNITIMTLK